MQYIFKYILEPYTLSSQHVHFSSTFTFKRTDEVEYSLEKNTFFHPLQQQEISNSRRPEHDA
jgi:hypothetical protein